MVKLTSLFQWCFASGILLLQGFNALSQNNSENDTSIVAIEITNINQESVRTNQLINKINSQISDQQIESYISESDVLHDTLSYYMEQLREEKARDFTHRELEIRLSELKLVETRLNQFLQTLNEANSKYGERLDKIRFEEKRWRKTYQELTAEGNNEFSSLINIVDNLVANIGAIKFDLLSNYNKIISIYNHISTLQQELDENIQQINEIILNRKENLFVTDSQPIWNIRINFKGFLDKSIRDIKALTKVSYSFLKTNINLVYRIIFLFVFFYLIFFFAKRHFLKVKSEIKSDEKSLLPGEYMVRMEIFKKPFQLSFVICLTIFLNTEILPIELKEITSVILIFPLLTILRQRIPREYFKYFLIIFLLFFIETISQILFYSNSLSRLINLGIGLTAALYIWFINTRILKLISQKFLFKNLLKAILFTMTVLLIVSGVSNVAGNMFFSENILFSVITSIFSGFVFYICFLVTSQIIVLFSITEVGRRLRIFKKSRGKFNKLVTNFFLIVFMIIWINSMLGFFGVDVYVYSFMDTIFSYNFNLGDINVVPANIVVLIFIIWFTFQLSKFIRIILEDEILTRFSLPRGVPGTISMLTRYAVITIGFFIAIRAGGLELDKLTIILGGLGVGIGFGLQNVFNNFISGLILAFERPIKVGDVVQMQDIYGTVREIGIRSSTVRTLDGAEVIVPNGNLISNELINWTLSDKFRRIDLRIGVAYGTDPDRVLEILGRCVENHQKIMSEPAPLALFVGFGDSSLDFRLLFWTSDFDNWLALQSEINVKINQALKDAGIEIPFPQRDLHLKTVSKDFTFKSEKKK